MNFQAFRAFLWARLRYVVALIDNFHINIAPPIPAHQPSNRENDMPAFAIVVVHGPKNPEKFEQYRAVAGEALAKHGGRVWSVTPKPPRLEGGMEVPGAIAMLEFPTADAAHAWHGDAELAAVHELRRDGADLSIFVTDAPG